MAGSYNHVVDENGNLESNETVVDMLENGGDVFEAVEEMYGMIWWLASKLGANAAGTKIIVEVARNNYQEGLDISREVHST